MSSLTIGSNTASLGALRNYYHASNAFAASMSRLTTGLRINRGADDPAGLIASEGLTAALASLDAQSRGMDRANSVASVADGALAEVSGLLSDANAAAVANANTAGMSQAERNANQMEIDSALQSIDRIAGATTFNGQRVLDGSLTISAGGNSVSIPSVATSDIGQVTIAGVGRTLSDAKSGGSLDSSRGGAQGAQAVISAAISQVATLRGQIGAFQSDTIGPQMRSNGVAAENLAAANSAIRDTDYASETARLTRAWMLQRSTLGILAMANSAPETVLGLLG